VYEIVRGSTTEKGPKTAIGGSPREIQRAMFVKSTGIIRGRGTKKKKKKKKNQNVGFMTRGAERS
jgi:hypothetical protein